MRTSGWWFLGFVLFASPTWADGRLEPSAAVVDELETILTDLQKSQDETKALRIRLTDLEGLVTDQQNALAAQDGALADLNATVDSLVAHDRETVHLAETLQAQLATERQWSSWVGTFAVATTTVAIMEGILLGWQR